MAFYPEGFKVGAMMLVPGELHFISIPGLGVETLSLPQRGRVRLKMLALHAANHVHNASHYLKRLAGPGWLVLFPPASPGEVGLF